MRIGVPAEISAGETRVAVTPETAKKLIAQGHSIHVQSGAGVALALKSQMRRVHMVVSWCSKCARRC
jgi:H+-translocating NAD(P) transhydrogenase subunit alpha